MNPVILFIGIYDDLYLGAIILIWLMMSVYVIWNRGDRSWQNNLITIAASSVFVTGLVTIFFAFVWFILIILSPVS